MMKEVCSKDDAICPPASQRTWQRPHTGKGGAGLTWQRCQLCKHAVLASIQSGCECLHTGVCVVTLAIQGLQSHTAPGYPERSALPNTWPTQCLPRIVMDKPDIKRFVHGPYAVPDLPKRLVKCRLLGRHLACAWQTHRRHHPCTC